MSEPEPDELSIEEGFKRLGAILSRAGPHPVIVFDFPSEDEQEDDDE